MCRERGENIHCAFTATGIVYAAKAPCRHDARDHDFAQRRKSFNTEPKGGHSESTQALKSLKPAERLLLMICIGLSVDVDAAAFGVGEILESTTARQAKMNAAGD
jgi:hypothetical protein